MKGHEPVEALQQTPLVGIGRHVQQVVLHQCEREFRQDGEVRMLRELEVVD